MARAGCRPRLWLVRRGPARSSRARCSITIARHSTTSVRPVCDICCAAAWPLRARGGRAVLARAHHVDRTLSRTIPRRRSGQVHERTLVMRRSLWSTSLGMVLAAAVLVAQGPAPATRVSPEKSRASPDAVVPGELVIEPADADQSRIRVVHPGRCQSQRVGRCGVSQEGQRAWQSGAAVAASAGRTDLRRVAHRSGCAQHVRGKRARSRARHVL